MRPVIIGAGPIGCYTALKIRSLNPIVLEEHKQAGLPVQCAGLVNKRLNEIVKLPDKLILNKVRGAKFYSKNESVIIDSGKKQAYVIDRAGFDQHLASLSNAEISFNESVKKHWLSNELVNVKTSNRLLKTDLVIDCRGPSKPTKYVIGLQVRAKLQRDPEFVELHFNSPGFFSWVIPEGDGICRIGLGAKEKPWPKLYLFLKKLGVNKSLDKQAGLIPLKVEPFCFDHLIKVGDSAGQVKSTTGGGIVTGLLSADYAAKAALKAYELSDFTRRLFLKEYYKPWSRAIGRELRIHLIIRGLLDKLGDKGYDLILKVLNENKELIEQYGDMDFPSKFIFKLIKLRNLPYLLRLIKCLL